MISILISVYQENVEVLISSLLQQLKSTNSPFEILIGDDSPTPIEPKFREQWGQEPIVYFHHSPSLSRSKNRNFLASKAQYEHLLFLDGDALVPSEDYLSNYLKSIDGSSCICGGTSYQDNKPEVKKYRFRWAYGRRREVHSARERSKKPYRGFSSFNFCIPANQFKRCPFNESLKGYGHEDTLLGYALEEKGIPVKHIDNPMIHNGLDEWHLYLLKTRQAVKGLHQLLSSPETPTSFAKDNRLYNSLLLARKLKMERLLARSHKSIGYLLETSLIFGYPSMILFDLYKLSYLIKIQI